MHACIECITRRALWDVREGKCRENQTWDCCLLLGFVGGAGTGGRSMEGPNVESIERMYDYWERFEFVWGQDGLGNGSRFEFNRS